MNKSVTQKDQEVAVPGFSIESLITQAVLGGVPVETMERLLAMRKELKAEAGREEFYAAMAQFQGECPLIKKTKMVRTREGVKAYMYAPLESIIQEVKEILQKNGFSYTIQTETLEGRVRAICIVRHRGGHSEQSSFEVPLGTKTALMSETQVTASALTFAKRYAFCNAFGILTSEEDTDASPDQSRQALERITGAGSLEELKTVFDSLGRLKANRQILAAKDAKKAQLSAHITKELLATKLKSHE